MRRSRISPSGPSTSGPAALALLFFFLVSAAPGPARATTGCLSCHAAPGRRAPVDRSALRASVHAELDCADCHADLAGAEPGKPHRRPAPAACGSCHDKSAASHRSSAHGRNPDGASCVDCHGGHDIARARAPGSRVSKRRQAATCTVCHRGGAAGRGTAGAPAATTYLDTVHGQSVLVKGLVVAPACSDCHGSHAIASAKRSSAGARRAQVLETCGRCHVGSREALAGSVHGAGGATPAPTCIDCHTPHGIEAPRGAAFRLATDERCGRCHVAQLETYRDTFHGKANALRQQRVAGCPDCHGHHDIARSTSARSRLSAHRRLDTCRRCHPAATASFAGYLPHPNVSDRTRYASLYWTHVAVTALLFAVLGFFALHTVLWLVRSLAFRLITPSAFREERQIRRHADAGKIYIRFMPIDRFTHLLLIISFLLLVLTGMPLKFNETRWAQWIFDLVGGVRMAGVLHRLGAILSLVYLGLHVIGLVQALKRNRSQYVDGSGRVDRRRLLSFAFGPDSPLPNRQDFRDFWAHQKWFFGRGPRPQFDRWTYWEKFDYLAVFWGMIFVGSSGLVLWFPTAAARLLPGWMINVATLLHSGEALLAAAFIFTFHFFNVHFRVERFPLDPVIFTGRITEETLLHERRRLYDRLKAAGRLAEERRKRNLSPVSLLTFGLGVLVLVAIFWGLASRLLPA